MKNEQKAAPLIFSMVKNPRLTGSVVPSSKYLSYAMAQGAQGAEQIIELGAGTGPITRVLRELYPDTPFVCVEYQKELAAELRQSFAGLDVRQETAKAVLDAVAASQEKIAIISALPFRSLPENIRDETVASIVALFGRCPNTKLIQFTYGLIAPFDLPQEVSGPISWRKIDKVWRNFPPATVWELGYQ